MLWWAYVDNSVFSINAQCYAFKYLSVADGLRFPGWFFITNNRWRNYSKAIFISSCAEPLWHTRGKLKYGRNNFRICEEVQQRLVFKAQGRRGRQKTKIWKFFSLRSLPSSFLFLFFPKKAHQAKQIRRALADISTIDSNCTDNRLKRGALEGAVAQLFWPDRAAENVGRFPT